MKTQLSKHFGKLLIIAVALFGITTTSMAAEGKKASYWVINQFNQHYTDVTDVTWVVNDQFAKASFLQEGVRLEAYYNQADGSFIGQSKAVAPQFLPKNASRMLEKQYSHFTIKEVIEFSSNTDVDFYVSLENDTQKLVLKVSRTGDVTVFKSIQK